MRTTVRLDDELLEQAKRTAARRGETLTSLIDRGLRFVLAQQDESLTRKRVRLPLSKASGGTLPGVDLNDSADLLDIMDHRK